MPQQKKQTSQEEWSFKQEAKEWGKTIAESITGPAEIDPQKQIEQQMEDQRKLANVQHFIDELKAQQQVQMQRSDVEKQQKEQQKEVEEEQEKQTDIAKKEQQKQVTQQQTLFNSQRRTEIKKIGG